MFLIAQLILSYYVLQQAASFPVGSRWTAELDTVHGTTGSEDIVERVPRADSELAAQDDDATGVSEEVTEDWETAAEHIYHANMGNSH